MNKPLALSLIPSMTQSDVKDAELTFDARRAPFDRIYTRYHLSMLTGAEALEQLRQWRALLKPGGLLVLMEVSAEWVAREIVADRLGPGHWLAIFGPGDAPRRSLFTMTHLRDLMAQAGLVLFGARTAAITVARDEADQVFAADVHVVSGINAGDGGGKQWLPPS